VSFPPGANFSANVTSGVTPLTVKFTDHSTGTVNGWDWDFGDGKSATTLAPQSGDVVHNYEKNGLYTVTLKAIGPEGESKKILKEYIAVAPRADFSYSSVYYPPNQINDFPRLKNQNCSSSCTVGPSGATVTFENKSDCAGPCTSYWEFGDGEVDEIDNLDPVNYTYRDRSEMFTVRLTVTGPGGSNTMERKDYIKVTPWAEIGPRNPSFTRTIEYYCGDLVSEDPPVSVTFYDVSQPKPYIQSREWSGGGSGDSITREFENSGDVTLTATNARNQNDKATSKVEIKINEFDSCPPPPPPPSESDDEVPGSTTGASTEQTQGGGIAEAVAGAVNDALETLDDIFDEYFGDTY